MWFELPHRLTAEKNGFHASSVDVGPYDATPLRRFEQLAEHLKERIHSLRYYRIDVGAGRGQRIGYAAICWAPVKNDQSRERE